MRQNFTLLKKIKSCIFTILLTTNVQAWERPHLESKHLKVKPTFWKELGKTTYTWLDNATLVDKNRMCCDALATVKLAAAQAGLPPEKATVKGLTISYARLQEANVISGMPRCYGFWNYPRLSEIESNDYGEREVHYYQPRMYITPTGYVLDEYGRFIWIKIKNDPYKVEANTCYTKGSRLLNVFPIAEGSRLVNGNDPDGYTLCDCPSEEGLRVQEPIENDTKVIYSAPGFNVGVNIHPFKKKEKKTETETGKDASELDEINVKEAKIPEGYNCGYTSCFYDLVPSIKEKASEKEFMEIKRNQIGIRLPNGYALGDYREYYDDHCNALPPLILSIHPGFALFTLKGLRLTPEGALYTCDEKGNIQFLRINPEATGLKDFLLGVGDCELEATYICNPVLFDLKKENKYTALFYRIDRLRNRRKNPDSGKRDSDSDSDSDDTWIPRRPTPEEILKLKSSIDRIRLRNLRKNPDSGKRDSDSDDT